MKSDDTVLTQAILPLLFHWKSSKKTTKMKNLNSPSVHEHMDIFTQGNHVNPTIYSLCPIKQLSIVFKKLRYKNHSK